MSFNQPPPNPYGGQPQQPGPPQGYGYPQQAGAPQGGGYAYPQQGQPGGYGQQPYGQQQPGPYDQQPQPGPYGQQPPPQQGGGWPVPPQPPKKHTGLIIGIIAAVVIVAVVIVLVLTNSGGSDPANGGGTGGGGTGGTSAVKYKIVTKQTVAGDWKKSAESDGNSSDMSTLPGITDGHDVQAGYEKGADSTKRLQFVGAWGTVPDPQEAVDAAFTQMDGSSDTSGKPIGSPQTVTPAGLDGGAVMKCQMFSSSDDGMSIKFPICLWADHSTIGMVADIDGGAMLTGGSVTIEQDADLAVQVRHDVLVPVS